MILVKVSKFQRVQTKIFLGVIKEKPPHLAEIWLNRESTFSGNHAHKIDHSTEHDKHNIKQTQTNSSTSIDITYY